VNNKVAVIFDLIGFSSLVWNNCHFVCSSNKFFRYSLSTVSFNIDAISQIIAYVPEFIVLPELFLNIKKFIYWNLNFCLTTFSIIISINLQVTKTFLINS